MIRSAGSYLYSSYVHLSGPTSEHPERQTNTWPFTITCTEKSPRRLFLLGHFCSHTLCSWQRLCWRRFNYNVGAAFTFMPLQLGLSSRPCYGSMCKQPPAGVEYPLVGNSSCRLCLTTNTLSAEHPHTYDSTISRRFWSAPADATFMHFTNWIFHLHSSQDCSIRSSPTEDKGERVSLTT